MEPLESAQTDSIRVFVDDDEGYLRWLAGNPGGYVLNTLRSEASTYRTLHRSKCGSISTPKTKNYTTGEYVKVCAKSAEELAAWARNARGGAPDACGRCRPQARGGGSTGRGSPGLSGHVVRDTRGFEHWIRGYQKFYEPIVLAYFEDQGWSATKRGSSIEKRDLRLAATRLAGGARKCNLPPEEKKQCIAHFRRRTRILTDGLLTRRTEDGQQQCYTIECKSWQGYTTSEETLRAFEGEAGWFMLVDSVGERTISGSALVIGGQAFPSADTIRRRLARLYARPVEVYFLDNILRSGGARTKERIRQQLEMLDVCVKRIKAQLSPESTEKPAGKAP